MPSRVPARNLRVLLVEDDDSVRRSLQLLLEWNGFEVRAHTRAASVIELEELNGLNLLVTDFLLPDTDGIALLEHLRDRAWAGRAVLITGRPVQPLLARARTAGFTAVLEKPIARHTLIGALTK